MLAHRRIAKADLDAKRTLSGGRAHDLRLDDFLDVLGLSQPLQSGSRQNHRIVFALFQLADSGVNVAAQRINLQSQGGTA